MEHMWGKVGVSVKPGDGGEYPHEMVHDALLGDEARRVLEIIFYSTLGGLIGVVGSAVNVINIIVFIKQGFSDSVSISLCALAVSDLGFLLTMTMVCICSKPYGQYSYTGVATTEINYMTGGIFALCFMRITTSITAFITFERCVCVALPLKVKTIITPKRTLISVIAMYVIIFATNVPIFSYFYLEPSFNVKTNKTVIVLQYTSKDFQSFSTAFNVPVQLCSFIIVTICTVFLVFNLWAKSKWRHEATSTSTVGDSVSIRGKRVMKMVTLISTIFIACYFPSVVNLLFNAFSGGEDNIVGSYENPNRVLWVIIDFVDGINSSVNILIYYNMSSRFRATFKGLLYSITHSIENIYTDILKNTHNNINASK